jgi:hypothetical protein
MAIELAGEQALSPASSSSSSPLWAYDFTLLLSSMGSDTASAQLPVHLSGADALAFFSGAGGQGLPPSAALVGSDLCAPSASSKAASSRLAAALQALRSPGSAVELGLKAYWEAPGQLAFRVFGATLEEQLLPQQLQQQQQQAGGGRGQGAAEAAGSSALARRVNARMV